MLQHNYKCLMKPEIMQISSHTTHVSKVSTNTRFTGCWGCTEAVGGGVLIPDGHRDDSEEAEVQSFVVPVTNGIQLETRRYNRRAPADESAATGDVSHCL